MSEFKSYGKIPQFRDVVYNVNKNCDYGGTELPTITFYGSVKLHGTNAAVGYDLETKELYIQSRKHKLPLESKHYGFGQWVKEHEKEWKEFFSCHPKEVQLVFGEWAGKGVQKNVGISKTEKQFYIFPEQFEIPDKEINWDPSLGQLLSYDYEVDIDFNDTNPAIEIMQELTLKVEECCPIAGEGVGEGIVWRTLKGLYRFKVKGEKHSVSKVTTLHAAPSYLKEVREFYDYAVTVNRVQQGIFETKTDSMKGMGNVIKWVCKDILEEEADVILKSDVEEKHIRKGLGKAVSKLAKQCILGQEV